MKLTIIIPAFNEEENIDKVIKKIPSKILGIQEIKILVIDDGSQDLTAKVAKKAGAEVFSFQKHMGLGKAFQKGIELALKSGADIIVNIDGDDQFNPEEIPKLVEPILKKQAHMVTGTRFKEKKKIPHMPLIKRIGNKLFVLLINLLTRENFTDTQCGFRAYSKEAALRLNLFGKFTYTQEVFLDLLSKDKKIVEVPVSVKYSPKRKSKIASSPLRYGLRALLIILRTFRDYYPLKFFGIPGIFILILGSLALAYSFIFWLFTHTTKPVRMLFGVGVSLVIFGLLLLILALIADMLKRIRKNQEEILYQLKKRNLK